jgi:hypothetical protein
VGAHRHEDVQQKLQDFQANVNIVKKAAHDNPTYTVLETFRGSSAGVKRDIIWILTSNLTLGAGAREWRFASHVTHLRPVRANKYALLRDEFGACVVCCAVVWAIIQIARGGSAGAACDTPRPRARVPRTHAA